MLIHKVVKSAGVSGLLLLAGAAAGQGVGNSPYSRIGLGEYNPNLGGIRQLSMGGTGLAAPNAVNVNELNPALLYYTARTTFEAVLTGQVRTVKNATASSRNANATLGYLAFSVPLSRRWGAAVGLKPLTGVNYETTPTQTVADDPTAQLLVQRRGTGGLSEVYFAQGVHVLRDFNLGATASYVFGTVDQSVGTVIVPAGTAVAEATQVLDRDQTRYADFTFRGGAHYRHKFGNQLNLNVGGVYSFQTDLRGTRTRSQERQNLQTGITDTTAMTAGTGYTTLPGLLQLGVTVDNDKNWTASLDVARQQWSKFQGFDQVRGSLDNTLRIGVGGELTPDPGSVEHYFRRVTYRAGLSVAQMPFRPAGQTLYDRAITWGFAFPLPTATPLEATTFSLGFAYGRRGNTSFLRGNDGESNVREDYLRVQFGVSLNNRWFIKRRLQ
ncbi:hypothetical protein [uncultured Hymenobacter sp.]|uniref:hypothetical protein n=1 Tax=uncultured Hymenobacter sp. TaxID=170016 RepID=UPI0035CA51AD